jgi:hypothetical protein
MRVLFDQGTPAPLRYALTAHIVFTAFEMGWSTLSNGDLLDAAEAQFDVFVTTDQNLSYQQNLAGRNLAILVLPFTSWPKLQNHIATIVSAVDGLKSGDYLELALP